MRIPVLIASALAFGAAALSPALAQDVVKIGAPLALTGGLADEGKKQAIAYDMWLKRVNAAGGIDVGGKKMKVELITYDYQTDGKRAQQMAEKLITDDKVHVLTAPFGSGHTKIVAGVAERYGIPIIASVASSESVYDQSFKNLFGTLAPNGGLVDAMLALFLKEQPNVKKVAILGRDDVFPRAMADALKAKAPAAGLQVVYAEYYAVGTMDHSAALSKIKSLSPDWIYVTGYTQDLILARKQMNDLAISAPIVTMITGPAYREFIDGLGPLANGVTSASWWHHSTTFKSDDVWGTTQAFYEEFKAREKADPDYVHASSAAALVALQKAIEKAGSLEPAKIREALNTLDIMTFYGPIKFGANGMNAGRDLPIIQVQGSGVKVLYPPSIEQAKLAVFK
ncbi:MAG TPA: amino acid ABC transporter substrate-binding protein [Caulobacteraceae bacterium]|nr:amino acid ABC transporter substrate-binding protein [Caulobacteraceae bacterium]